ncbi:hypothetical protein WJX81_000667 [Elliptochloris bilobata]|uniref:Flagellar associated protein n=1 Tax=Elliptochloris bilobata TaxID=381761 RepID=A0AAW1QCA7_9CHLO
MAALPPASARGGRLKDSWRATSLRSTFGPQCLAHLQTGPSCGFGSSLREANAQTYVSPEADRALCRAQGGNNSQGAIYRVQDSLGTQQLSTLPSAPVSGFGTGKRPGMADRTRVPGPGAYKARPALGLQVDSTKQSASVVAFSSATRDAAGRVFISVDHEKSGYGRESPGPSAYLVAGGLGRQQLSERESLPQWRMGSEPRFHGAAARQSATMPGPGQYATARAVGPQQLSTKRSTPTVGFSRADRDSSKKLFISLEHEKSAYGTCSPGPCTATVEAAASSRRLSTQPQPSAWGFGTSRRLPQERNDAPGPGEYFA